VDVSADARSGDEDDDENYDDARADALAAVAAVRG
jgi:hypothetical protein